MATEECAKGLYTFKKLFLAETKLKKKKKKESLCFGPHRANERFCGGVGREQHGESEMAQDPALPLPAQVSLGKSLDCQSLACFIVRWQ